MRVVKVFFDPRDSWTANTRRLVVIAKDTASAIRYIAQKENKTEETVAEELVNRPYWSLEPVHVFDETNNYESWKQ